MKSVHSPFTDNRGKLKGPKAKPLTEEEQLIETYVSDFRSYLEKTGVNTQNKKRRPLRDKTINNYVSVIRYLIKTALSMPGEFEENIQNPDLYVKVIMHQKRTKYSSTGRKNNTIYYFACKKFVESKFSTSVYKKIFNNDYVYEKVSEKVNVDRKKLSDRDVKNILYYLKTYDQNYYLIAKLQLILGMRVGDVLSIKKSECNVEDYEQDNTKPITFTTTIKGGKQVNYTIYQEGLKQEFLKHFYLINEIDYMFMNSYDILNRKKILKRASGLFQNTSTMIRRVGEFSDEDKKKNYFIRTISNLPRLEWVDIHLYIKERYFNSFKNRYGQGVRNREGDITEEEVNKILDQELKEFIIEQLENIIVSERIERLNNIVEVDELKAKHFYYQKYNIALKDAFESSFPGLDTVDSRTKISTHDLRRYAARKYYNKNHDLIATKNLLQHSNVTNTEKYLRNSKEDLNTDTKEFQMGLDL